MATLKDIAKMVGISVSAASLAIRDHDSISQKTKRRVWGAQEKLGYKPGKGGRPLRQRGKVERTRSTADIAFVLCDRGFDDKLYARVFEAVTDSATVYDVRPIYVPAKLKDLQNGKFPPLLIKPGIEGIIVSGVYDKEAHAQLGRLNVPIVVSGNYSLGNKPWAACEIDISLGVRLMVDHFVGLGHRKVGLVLKAYGSRYASDIEDAFLRYTAQCGIKQGGVVIWDKAGDWEASLETLLRSPDRPTALVLSTDALGRDVSDICKKCGLSIPDDLSLIGFESGYESGGLSLTIVRADSADLGKLTIEKLMRLVLNPESLPTREVIGMSLIEGDSSGPASS